MTNTSHHQILGQILAIQPGNLFLQKIVERVQREDYRGWHVSQHNRYGTKEVRAMLQVIYDTVAKKEFFIPPGDYGRGDALPAEFQDFGLIVAGINSELGKGTINSVKKNFFPDLDSMQFLKRTEKYDSGLGKTVLCGELTQHATDMLQMGVTEQFKAFSDGIDRLFGNKMTRLAEMIYFSDYAGDPISIFEFMLLSYDEEGWDEIAILESYRSLPRYKRDKARLLTEKYANPSKFFGDKTHKRDFHNWKNQAQQMLWLLGGTVYFQVVRGKSLQLNVGQDGFYREIGGRSGAVKSEYFAAHAVAKQDGFELHHIVPVAAARNIEETKRIDNWRNLIYIDRSTHRNIGRHQVILAIDASVARFTDLHDDSIMEAQNDATALYSKEQNTITQLNDYNRGLLKGIYDYDAP